MIIDYFENLSLYNKSIPGVEKFIDYLKDRDIRNSIAGKHVIDSEGTFFYCFEYDTKAEESCKGEVHQKFVDIHVMLSGSERIGFADRKDVNVSDYDEAGDYSAADGFFEMLELQEMKFAIFLPHETHVTGIKVGQDPVHIKKLVLKVPFVVEGIK